MDDKSRVIGIDDAVVMPDGRTYRTWVVERKELLEALKEVFDELRLSDNILSELFVEQIEEVISKAENLSN